MKRRSAVLGGLFASLAGAVVFVVALPAYGNWILCSLVACAIALLTLWTEAFADHARKYLQQPQPSGGGGGGGGEGEVTGVSTVRLLLEDNAEEEDGSTVTVAAPPPPPRRREVYLDNIKAALTAIVVLHHCTCSFGPGGFYMTLASYRSSFQPFGAALLALNQSYFMSLFFFISAYFTPVSYERKGPFVFLRGKLLRLGLPFFAYLFVLGPAVDFFIRAVGTRTEGETGTYHYSPDAGPPWFLAWLLIFNGCFMLLKTGKTALASVPSRGRQALIGLSLGVVQGMLAALIGPVGGFFVYMPITFGSLPFDILAFSAGVVSRRNGWLADASGNLKWPINTPAASRSIIATAVFACCCFATETLLYISKSSLGFGFVSDSADDDGDFGGSGSGSGSGTDDGSVAAVAVFIALFAVFGWACLFISTAVLAVFQMRFNASTSWRRFFVRSAYTVYVIHPAVIVPVVYSYVCILRALGETVYFDVSSDSSVSTTRLSSDGLIWAGWVYTSVVSQLLVWPLADRVRRMPGLRRVL